MKKYTKKDMLTKIFGIAFDENSPAAEKIGWEIKAAAAVASSEVAKVTFTGSEKQAAWVEKIVKGFFCAAFKGKDVDETALYIAALRKELAAHSEAKYWIDRREKSLDSLFKDVDDQIEAFEDGDPTPEEMETFVRNALKED